METKNRLQRVQVLLFESQIKYLNKISQKTGKNVSALLRDLVNEKVKTGKERALAFAARELRAVYGEDSELTEYTELDHEDWDIADTWDDRDGFPGGDKSTKLMTHTEKIIHAVKELTKSDLNRKFSRNDVKLQAGISDRDWQASYNPTFQGMRIDHPGGAPSVGKGFKGVFRRTAYGIYVLTDKGKKLVNEPGS